MRNFSSVLWPPRRQEANPRYSACRAGSTVYQYGDINAFQSPVVLSKCIYDLGNHPPDLETRFTLLE